MPNDRFAVNNQKFDVKTVQFRKDKETIEGNYLSLTIPKFKIKFDKSLTQILRTLGIEHAFNKITSNFSEISCDQSNRKLHVPQAVKKFFLRRVKKVLKLLQQHE